ncbi:hypothetical protein FN846DRAFT_903591 [Sphaerosporella brunnea]|uniref:Uncharacterized protein n=1 Tax=Sphaerosporella brunnea TaxID=1250544 RepID=A0A5J5F6R5_9PEZI|nr:hypothetical protein FN846DRAFT_903591 [Sphaerosporella brunnea]
MARTAALLTSSDTPAVAAKNLTRLLSRLDQKLASSSPTTTSVERARIAANLEYARRLLHTLEADITVRQKSSIELGTQKQTIRRLNERLQLQLAEAHDAEDDGDAKADEDNDDDYASLKKSKRKPTDAAAAATVTIPTSTPTSAATAVAKPTFTLRKRTEKTAEEMKSELFGGAATATGISKPNGAKEHEVTSTEAMLDIQRAEQENITEDLLQMAKLLKESSVTFGASLESEKAYLDAAQEGLDRNNAEMQLAGNNMDSLRKNDNVSFLWTMIYMAIIVALVFLTLLVLFFAPKLRWR